MGDVTIMVDITAMGITIIGAIVIITDTITIEDIAITMDDAIEHQSDIMDTIPVEANIIIAIVTAIGTITVETTIDPITIIATEDTKKYQPGNWLARGRSG